MKQYKNTYLAVCILLAGLGITLAQAQTVPYMMSYQGLITSGGENFDGTGYFKFALVNAAGDATYWSNDGTSFDGNEPTDAVELAVADGLFMVMLGDHSISNMEEDLTPYTFDYRDDAHLRIWFSEDNIAFTQLLPDQPLGSVPYAMMAGRVPFGSIDANQLAGWSVTEQKIATGAVTSNKLANGSVTADKLAADSVTSAAIADGTITEADLHADLRTWTFWRLDGNTGTDPDGDFIGTSDNQPLHFRVNDQRVLRLEYTEWDPIYEDGAPNIIAGSPNNWIEPGRKGSALLGGYFHQCKGDFSVVAGGYFNWIHEDAQFATIVGGSGNRAASYAFAAGRQAKANHQGTFVWGDSTDAEFASTRTNQFLIRAGGGVGINTNNPAWEGGAVLAVATHSTNIPAIRLIGPGGVFKYGARLAFGDLAHAFIEEIEDDRLHIYSRVHTAIRGGYVGINTLNAGYRLHVEGDAGKPGGGSWSDSSDARLKTDVREISGALARLTQLRGVTFEWIHPDQHGRAPGEREAGLIAQEVEAIFPEWITEGPVHGADAALIGEDGRMKSLSFPHSFNAYVIEAFKELEAENAELKARLERLEAMLGERVY